MRQTPLIPLAQGHMVRERSSVPFCPLTSQILPSPGVSELITVTLDNCRAVKTTRVCTHWWIVTTFAFAPLNKCLGYTLGFQLQRRSALYFLNDCMVSLIKNTSFAHMEKKLTAKASVLLR